MLEKIETGLQGEVSLICFPKKHMNTTSCQTLTPAEISFVEIFKFLGVL